MMWDNADAPRRVLCDKEVAAALQEDQQFQLLQTQHQQKRRLPPVNPLDLLSATAIWDNAAAAAFTKSPPSLKAKARHAAAAACTTPTATVLAEQEHVAARIAVSAPTACLSHRIRTLGAGYNEHAVNDQLSYIWN